MASRDREQQPKVMLSDTMEVEAASLSQPEESAKSEGVDVSSAETRKPSLAERYAARGREVEQVAAERTRGFLERAVAKAGELWNRSKDFLSEDWAQTKADAKGVARGAAEMGKSAVAGAKSGARAVGENVVAAGEFAAAAGAAAWETGADYMKNDWAETKADAKGVARGAAEMGKSAINTVGSVWERTKNFFKADWAQTKADAKGVARGAAEMGKSVAKGAVELGKAGVEKTVAGARAAREKGRFAMDVAVGAAVEGPGDLKRAAIDAKDKVVDGAKEQWMALSESAVAAKDRLSSRVGAAKNKFVGWFNDKRFELAKWDAERKDKKLDRARMEQLKAAGKVDALRAKLRTEAKPEQSAENQAAA